MQNRDVIFLGAGASASEGAPLQSDLFRDFFTELNNEGYNLITNEMKICLEDFFETFFGININNNDLKSIHFPTFEEILGILEIALNREESFKGYSLTPSDSKIQEIRENLIFLISIILEKKLRRINGYHERLIGRLRNEKLLKNTTFISLNYDIIIDNALLGLYQFFTTDYGIYFTNHSNIKEWVEALKSRRTCLYKLHGSLNWIYCPTCISVELTSGEKRASSLAKIPKKCSKCNTNMIPIVIPPTFFKVMSNYYLQQIWRKAERALLKADRIFFCGYSFPDADIHIKYLLKRIEVNSGKTPEIYIINNYCCKKDYEKNTEKERYTRFFKNNCKIHYTDKSFQQFSEQRIE